MWISVESGSKYALPLVDGVSVGSKLMISVGHVNVSLVGNVYSITVESKSARFAIKFRSKCAIGAVNGSSGDDSNKYTEQSDKQRKQTGVDRYDSISRIRPSSVVIK